MVGAEMTETPIIRLATFESTHRQLVSVYRAVFTEPPYSEDEADVQDFAARFPDHVQRPGFRSCVAQQDERIVGFAYGFTGEPGDGWWDMVADRLSDDEVETWLDDCFAFAELAVIPTARGQGIGGRLHDALLSGLPHRTAVLSTFTDETPAMRLYRKRGWVTLLDDFVFPGRLHPCVVMGLKAIVQKSPCLNAPPNVFRACHGATFASLRLKCSTA
jgi:GNAT superfamily N-acetyltransferase